MRTVHGGSLTRDNRDMFVYSFRCNHIATQHDSAFKSTAPPPNFEKGDTTHGCIEEAFFEEILEEILEKGRRA